MPNKIVRNATDTFVKQSAAAKNFGHAGRLQIRSQSGDNRYGYIFFNRPFPRQVRIVSAKLRFWTAESISGAYVLRAQRVADKWAANRITWTDSPGVTGSIKSSSSISGAAAGRMFEIDVTDLMQDVVGGAPWYGFRITTSTASSTGIFRSAQNGVGTQRPQLYVQWTEAPSIPSNLTPSGGKKVSSQKPLLTYDFDDPNGEGDLARTKVQIASDEDGVTIDFDSGWVNTDLPQLLLSATAYAGLPSGGGSKWWRVTCEDEDGNESGWSDWVEMAYNAQGTPSISLPNGLTEGSPLVSWGLSGQTQKSYQVWVATPNDPDNWLWDSGKITSSATSLSIPWGVLRLLSQTYRIGVRLWDTAARVSQPGAPAWVQAYTDVTYSAGGATRVSSLNATSDSLKPIISLTWERGSAAEEYQIFRKRVTQDDYTFFDHISEDDASTGSSTYAWSDYGVDWYRQYDYQVIAVSSNVGSPAASASAQARKLAPFLMRADGTDVVCFLNPERSRESRSIQELHEPMEGPPILVTQSLGGYTGHVKGVLVDGWPSGYTAEGMRDSFESIKDDPGIPMKLSYADVCLKVVPFNMQWDSFADNEGIYYIAEFDWVTVEDIL